jgi:glycosyltransferase involved in cell wall biosynthesis
MTAIPPLTVGLPVYNGERFLADALDSVLGQTYGDFRLVISDNGSTDATEAICRDYATRDPRVVYLRYDVNRGAGWNFNHVFEHCDTPFFRWAASDDLFAPTCFERSAEVLAEAPSSVAMCYSKTLIIDGQGNPTGEHDDDLDLRSSKPHARIHRIIRTIVQANPIFGLIRSDALRTTRLHGSYPSADYVLIAELALAGEIWELPDRLFYRRLHGATSRVSNPSPEEYTVFIDPSVKPVKHEAGRLLREYLAAVRHGPLSPLERAQCYAAVTAAWTRRYAMSKEPLRRIKRVFRQPVTVE